MFRSGKKQLFYIILLIAILNGHNVMALHLKLTKLVCTVSDKSFMRFDECRVKAESRDLQYFKIYTKYFQLPIEDINMRFQFLKRANGYKPFLYDFTIKCDFLKHMNPLVKIIWRLVRDVSNLNHSCPFVEDFKIDRLENRYVQKEMSALPLPNGDYAIFVNFKSYNITRFTVEFYGSFF